jgi:hypothetical protein
MVSGVTRVAVSDLVLSGRLCSAAALPFVGLVSNALALPSTADGAHPSRETKVPVATNASAARVQSVASTSKPYATYINAT